MAKPSLSLLCSHWGLPAHSQIDVQKQTKAEATMRTTSLLSLTKMLFQDIGDVQAVVTRIMTQAADLINCERCSVFLVRTNTLHGHDSIPGIRFSLRGYPFCVATCGVRPLIQADCCLADRRPTDTQL